MFDEKSRQARSMNGKITYRQQYTRCGKQRCKKCQQGAGHGPYWYAYWSEKGRTVSKYIGVHLPNEDRLAKLLPEEGDGKKELKPIPPPAFSPILRISI